MTMARSILPVVLGAAMALSPLTASARPMGGPGQGKKGPLIVAAELLNKLKLTAPQKTKIFAILGQHKNEIVAAAGAKIEAHAQLQDAIQAANPDQAAIKKAAATLADADLRVAQLQSKIRPQVMAVLTVKQKAEVMAVMAQAHGWMGGMGHEGMGKDKAAMGKGHGPAKGGPLAHMLEFAAEHANLTAQQKEQIKGVFQARKAQLMTLHKSEREAEKALRQTIHQGADAKALREAAGNVARTRLDFALERAQIHARVAKLLTPAQRTQLESLRTDMQGVRLERAHAILTLVRELL
jgi:Spy/CpxP family protein refolding chaperone